MFKICGVLGLLLVSSVAFGGGVAYCEFVHDQYPGTCPENVPYDGVKVSTAAEACLWVLTYLNKPDTSGLNYCRNTSLRGGWTLVKFEGSN